MEQKDLTAFRRPFIRAHHTRFEISWDHLIGQPISADVHRASSYDTSTFSYEPNVFNVVLSTIVFNVVTATNISQKDGRTAPISALTGLTESYWHNKKYKSTFTIFYL